MSYPKIGLHKNCVKTMKMKEEFRVLPSYSEEFKRKIIKEILTGKYSKKEIVNLYNLRWNTIQRWLNKFGQSVILEEGIKTITLKKYNNVSRKNKITESEKVIELREQIKQLKKELEDAELKAELYDKMIEIAEEQFKIPIRKKYVTKRSDQQKRR